MLSKAWWTHLPYHVEEIVRKRHLISLGLVGSMLAILLASCASFNEIAKIEGVKDVDWILNEGIFSSGPVVDAANLKPGQQYHVSVKYLQQDKDGKESWKYLINYTGVEISVSDGAFAVKSATIDAPSDPFFAFKEGKTVVTVKFPASIGKEVSKVVALAPSRALPPFEGSPGQAGNNGSSTSPAGTAGSIGADAPMLDFEVAHYSTKGTQLADLGSLVVVREINSNKVWLMTPNNLVEIDAKGGDGGIGGRGSDMTLPQGSPLAFIQGGAGGAGGNGGRGGIVHIIAPLNSALSNSFIAVIDGGKGGMGGPGGVGQKGANTGSAALNFLASAAVNGVKGRDGQAGPGGKLVAENKDLGAMFLNIKSPYFDRARLEP
jgi:hypothetical protein